MTLVRQPKTAGFRPKSRYEYIIFWLSKFQAKLCLVVELLLSEAVFFIHRKCISYF